MNAWTRDHETQVWISPGSICWDFLTWSFWRDDSSMRHLWKVLVNHFMRWTNLCEWNWVEGTIWKSSVVVLVWNHKSSWPGIWALFKLLIMQDYVLSLPSVISVLITGGDCAGWAKTNVPDQASLKMVG